jgi:hypothetical protein
VRERRAVGVHDRTAGLADGDGLGQDLEELGEDRRFAIEQALAE